jgi:hypothetical protein
MGQNELITDVQQMLTFLLDGLTTRALRNTFPDADRCGYLP